MNLFRKVKNIKKRIEVFSAAVSSKLLKKEFSRRPYPGFFRPEAAARALICELVCFGASNIIFTSPG